MTPTADEIRSQFRRLDPAGHRAVPDLLPDEIYDNGEVMAPGGLLFARMIAERLKINEGQRVLDLGCGRGQSSVLLASRFGARVVAVDLWIENGERDRRAGQLGLAGAITNLKGDVRRGLPADIGEFDSIFCMQSFHTFGTARGIVNYLGGLLKSGGRICIGQTCFNREPGELPRVFRQTDGWNAEYEKYHSPDWWRRFFEDSGAFDVDSSAEIDDGQVMWEDHVLYSGDRAGWTTDYLEKTRWLTNQLIWGQSRDPHLTHFILSAGKKAEGDNRSNKFGEVN